MSSRTIAPEENCPLTLTQFLIGGDFPRVQLFGHRFDDDYLYGKVSWL